MAMTLIEGWDHYDVRANGSSEKGWNGNPFSNVSGRGFIGGQAISVIINNQVYKQLASSYSTFTVGAAIQISDTACGTFLTLSNSGTFVASLSIGADLRLFVTDTAARTFPGTTLIRTNVWFYVEMKIVVGTSGTTEVRLNGNSTSEITGTGNFGTSNINRVQFECHSLSGATLVDDVYGTDGSFLGDIVVRTLYPNGDGTHQQWTPDTGSTHYTRVNEHNFDGDGSYVYDGTVGHIDSYDMDDSPGTVAYAAQLNLGARKGDAGLRQIAPMMRQSGTDYVGPTETLSTDYAFYSWMLDNDPSGSPWTVATINADECGVKTIA
jgi:hypothetical protein